MGAKASKQDSDRPIKRPGEPKADSQSLASNKTKNRSLGGDVPSQASGAGSG